MGALSGRRGAVAGDAAPFVSCLLACCQPVRLSGLRCTALLLGRQGRVKNRALVIGVPFVRLRFELCLVDR